jgi:hypothetical protein
MSIDDIPEEVLSFSNISLEECLYEEFRYGSTTNLKEIRKVAKELFYEKIVPYYSEININVNNAVYNFILEPLKNANFHGESDTSIKLLLSHAALIAGFSDGGIYFKRSVVKEHWEKRELFPEKHEVEEKQIGYSAGTSLIYSMSDLIHVDNDSGTLYIGLSTDGRYF